MSALDAAALLVGSMIGSGIFIAPSLMARNISAPGVYLGLWILAGVYTLLGALSFAELAAMMPEAGTVCLSPSGAGTARVSVRLDAALRHSVGLHRGGGHRFAKYLGIFFRSSARGTSCCAAAGTAGRGADQLGDFGGAGHDCRPHLG